MTTKNLQECHYVYKITNLKPTDERKYYIGVRTAPNGTPQDDTKYMGSSKYLKESINELGLEHFSKEILSTWDTREEANLEEYRLHQIYDVASNPEFFNRAVSNGKEFCTHGFVTVKDRRDNKTKNVSKEDFNNFNYYEATTKNLILVKDKKTNKHVKITKEDFVKNKDFYEMHRNNIITVIDIRTGAIVTVSTEDYKKFDYYVNLKAKKIGIFDSNDNIIYTCYGNFKKFCKEKNLLFDALTDSYRNGGYSIYKNITNIGKRRLEKTGREHQIGWYAKLLK